MLNTVLYVFFFLNKMEKAIYHFLFNFRDKLVFNGHYCLNFRPKYYNTYLI